MTANADLERAATVRAHEAQALVPVAEALPAEDVDACMRVLTRLLDLVRTPADPQDGP